MTPETLLRLVKISEEMTESLKQLSQIQERGLNLSHILQEMAILQGLQVKAILALTQGFIDLHNKENKGK
jgi:hypothetical protein